MLFRSLNLQQMGLVLAKLDLEKVKRRTQQCKENLKILEKEKKDRKKKYKNCTTFKTNWSNM